MGLIRVKVDGFDELIAALEESQMRTIILFTGSKDGDKSWCPDCIAGKFQICITL